MSRAVFDIFLSSTSVDLQEYRAKVNDMITRMRQTTVRMETFGAKPAKPLAACRDEVGPCDALIVIVGHRYGWIPSKKEGGDAVKSITWWEVQWALDAKKPVYAFLVDPRAAWAGEREQDRLTAAKTDAEVLEIGRAVRNLQTFRAFLKENTTHDLFTSADDLASKVATSLHDWLLRQAVSAARAAYPAEESRPLPSVPVPPAGNAAPGHGLYWQEQVHLLSAQRAAGDTREVRIALIAGRANTAHPALSGAAVKYFDARSNPRESPPDDYTTGLASLLVGGGTAEICGGIAPQSRLLVLQVLDDEATTSTPDVLAALDVAMREGVDVVCLPLGGLAKSEAEETAYRHAAEQGLVVVCPAGNASSAEQVYPAAYPGCISAAAVDVASRLASFSTYGDWVTTSAPGVDIMTAAGVDGYQRWSGTSFACAIVAGAVALMRAVNRELTAEQAGEILRSVGVPVLDARASASAGSLRMLDALKAVLRAAPEEPDPETITHRPPRVKRKTKR